MSNLLKVGFFILNLLQEQIKQGIDEDGRRYKYSTKPFSRPYVKIKGEKALSKNKEIEFFKTKRDTTWIVFKGGYKSYRELTGRSGDNDFLQYSGAMLNAMSVKEYNGKAIIYFNNPKQAEKAFWLTKSGAGKSRHTFKFMGLTKQNKRIAAEFAAKTVGSDTIKNLIRF